MVNQSCCRSSGIVALSFGFLFRQRIMAHTTSFGTGTFSFALSSRGGDGGISPFFNGRGGGGEECEGNSMMWSGFGMARILATAFPRW